MAPLHMLDELIAFVFHVSFWGYIFCLLFLRKNFLGSNKENDARRLITIGLLGFDKEAMNEIFKDEWIFLVRGTGVVLRYSMILHLFFVLTGLVTSGLTAA